MIRYF